MQEHCISVVCAGVQAVRVVALCCARWEHARSRHSPASPTPSRRRTSQPCRNGENTVATDFSFTLKRRCRDTKIISRHENNPQCSITVATPKLSRDTKTPAAQNPVAILKTPVRADALAACAAPLLSRHHYNVAIQN